MVVLNVSFQIAIAFPCLWLHSRMHFNDTDAEIKMVKSLFTIGANLFLHMIKNTPNFCFCFCWVNPTFQVNKRR